MVKLNLKQMKMKDFVKWQKDVQSASTASDFDTLYALQAQVITEWDFPGDPKDANSYGELTLEQWTQVQKQAAEEITKGFSQ